MTDERRFFRFVRYYGGSKVVFKCPADLPLCDLLDEFTAFLRGCGYHCEGTLDFVGVVLPDTVELDP